MGMDTEYAEILFQYLSADHSKIEDLLSNTDYVVDTILRLKGHLPAIADALDIRVSTVLYLKSKNSDIYIAFQEAKLVKEANIVDTLFNIIENAEFNVSLSAIRFYLETQSGWIKPAPISVKDLADLTEEDYNLLSSGNSF